MQFPSRAGLGSMAYKKGKWIIISKKRCVVPVKTNSAFGNIRGQAISGTVRRKLDEGLLKHNLSAC